MDWLDVIVLSLALPYVAWLVYNTWKEQNESK